MTFQRMKQTRERTVRRQGELAPMMRALLVVFVTACTERGITNPSPTGGTHPGFDISIYAGEGRRSAWRQPGSPYEWVGYYLQAPCHRDASWMGKRLTLTTMGWGLALLFVGQQTFDGVPDIEVPVAFDRALAAAPDSLPKARAGIITPETLAEQESGAVTCSRTLLPNEQGRN